jgi:hypothetical protein
VRGGAESEHDVLRAVDVTDARTTCGSGGIDVFVRRTAPTTALLGMLVNYTEFDDSAVRMLGATFADRCRAREPGPLVCVPVRETIVVVTLRRNRDRSAVFEYQLPPFFLNSACSSQYDSSCLRLIPSPWLESLRFLPRESRSVRFD